ncbi:MAG TPA: pirin family protein [Steroidobacteraceae bacterium]|jgi:quercetin 2,3-dioxygenase|nr:pirin family protein [Steroidobacteraceae bacterium]
MTERTLLQLIPARDTSDGAGVRLRRSIGQGNAARLDPFLMLDEFASDDPNDYIAGFPPHPHRGFQTVTYMLEGHMRHEDHLGHRGELRSGGVQWMTAGRGIVHSEMPQQEHGRMHGFQLWINLPGAEKMKPAGYRDIPAGEIPGASFAQGVTAKVIAGTLRNGAAGEAAQTRGPIQGLSTDPLLADLVLPPGAALTTVVPADYTACLYVYAGSLHVGADGQVIGAHCAGALSPGDSIALRAGAEEARALLLVARPLREPVVQHGPFVMNTRAEIEQAIADYSSGEFTRRT